MHRNDLKKKAGGLPDAPGVYLMKDGTGKIIYVGKAKSLRKRVRSYFQNDENLDRKTRLMMRRTAQISYINAGSEVEALLLESNMIKEHRPRYNVMLKDDKRYPFIKVTVDEPFPRVLVTRRVTGDGAKYFGPYTAAHKMRTTLKTIRSIFPIRTCHYHLPEQRPEREGLDYHIGRCLCPCMGHQSQEDYRSMIDEVCLFLSGRQEEVKKRVERKMRDAALRLEFEKAARLRDRLQAIEIVSQKQRVLSPGMEHYDIVALGSDEHLACGVILKVREGKLLGIEHHFLSNIRHDSAGTVLSLFMARYYLRERDFPRELILPFSFEDLDLVQTWLRSHASSRIRITVPRRGEKKKLVELALRNADLFLDEIRSQKRRNAERGGAAREELKSVLHLEEAPGLIGCFDVSNIGNDHAVGALAVFDRGNPARSRYRNYRIRSVGGQDDYAMMREIVGRFAAACSSGDEERLDLLVIDGGKGQLAAALQGLSGSGVSIPVIALAKKEEEIFLPGVERGLRLSRRSEVLRLLMRLRDEAHRCAITYHRKSRSKALRHSLLDEVRGVGPKRKSRLLEAFGSVDGIAKAAPEEVAERAKVPLDLAARLKEHIGAARGRASNEPA